MTSPSDRCTAALIASAVGDALGAPTEFMTRSKIVDAAYQGYKHWLRTQEPHIEVDVDAYPSALFADPRMHRRRTPGYTCITSLRDHSGPGTRANPHNDSKGCGTVMRIAPVGMIYRQHDDQYVFDLGADISAITRG